MAPTNIGDPLTSNLRVATFSIAAFDFIQTIPGEIKLYRRQIAQGRMSLVCFLFIVVRYVSVASLVLNGVGFYSSSFDAESCRKFRLAAPVTKMVAGLASQGLIFMRTWAISRKSRFVLIVLSILCIITLPMMVIGNVYKRDPYLKDGSCIAKQAPGAFNSAPMYYGAMTGFDVIACGIATYYLIDRNSSSAMSKFTKKVMQHGMIYAFGTTLGNIIVLLGTSHVKYVEKLGAFLSVAVTMIMAQRLVLATQNARDGTTSFISSRALRSSTTASSSGARGTNKRTQNSGQTDTFELGVRVHTETIHMVEPQRRQSAAGSIGSIGTGDIEDGKRASMDDKVPVATDLERVV
ncbi:hypothetical protein ACGC1H_006050 [Rhizoctonia solani]